MSPKVQNVSSQKMETGYGLRADFDVELIKFDDAGNPVGRRSPVRNCPNLITNIGMDLIGSTQVVTLGAFLHIGSGSTAPAFTDAALVTKIAAVAAGGVGNNVSSWDVTNPRTYVYTRVYTFAVGSATGSLRELGLSTASNGSLVTRALFKDAFGDPTTVEVAADEQLVVTYRLYIVPNEVDGVLIKVQNGTEYTLTYRLAYLGVFTPDAPSNATITGVLYSSQSTIPNNVYYTGPTSGVGPVTGGPTGTQSAIFHGVPAFLGTYTNGDYYRDDSMTIPLGLANANEIGAFHSYNGGWPFRWQIGILPRVNKTSNDTLKFVIRTRWYRL